MYKLKFFLLLVLLVFAPTLFSNASEYVLDTDPSQLSYVFKLYYDNGQLFADRDSQFKYDVIPEEFKPEVLTTQFPFSGEIVNLKGEVASVFKFDPRRGNPNFSKGKISVKAPYIPDGQKVVFYDFQGGTLLTIFVSESSFCDDNGICNSEKGEDNKTCPNDCAGILPTTPTAPSEKAVSLMSWIILILTIVGAGLGGWFGWKWWKNRSENKKWELPIIPPV